MSFYDILFNNNVKVNAGKSALECDNTVYTYEELDRVITRLAERLQKIGVGRMDKVMLMHNNPCQYTLIMLAIIKIGAIPMPVYSKMGQSKLESMIQFYEVNYLIKAADNIFIKLEECDTLQCGEGIDTYEIERGWTYIPETQDAAANIDDVDKIKDGLIVYRMFRDQDSSLELVKLILFTSGTTSTPKAIMLSQENIYANITSICDYLKLEKEDNILLIKDLSHSSSITSELFVGLFTGCKIVMTTQLPITKMILKILEKQNISVFFAVPTLLKGIMSYTKLPEYDLSKLRIINFYGASMYYMDILRLVELFPTVDIFYSYGQTEASPRVTYIERENLLKKPASCGREIKNVKVYIEDTEGNLLEPNVQGEVIVTGANVMLGYYKNPEKTADTVINGKLHTRDLGYMDEDGFLYITGRMDNMIISGGKNIYPEEIEGVLTSYEGVIEALCTARKKGNETSDLIAYIVLNEGYVLDYEGLLEYCKSYLELYKIPKEIIVVEELEKTPSGKIKRTVTN